MPIKVACTCGAAFAAKDELAGRTVACPKCKQPLKIPAPQAAGVTPQPLAPAAHSNAGVFDDLGLKARDANVPRCPSCAAEMAPNAILCIKCGYNTKLGKRMQTINMAADPNAALAGGGGGHGGHGGDVTAMIMARAARNADEDVEEEKKKTDEGLPLWMLVVAVLGCVLFGIVMSLIPQGIALIGTALILTLVAALILLYSWIRVMIVAGKKNLLYPLGIFFGDLLLGVSLFFLARVLEGVMEGPYLTDWIRLAAGAVWLTYAYLNADECGPYIMLFWIAKGLQIAAGVLAFIGLLVLAASKDDEQGAVPQPVPSPGVQVSAPVHSLPFPIC